MKVVTREMFFKSQSERWIISRREGHTEMGVGWRKVAAFRLFANVGWRNSSERNETRAEKRFRF